jgi:hypothetical protein
MVAGPAYVRDARFHEVAPPLYINALSHLAQAAYPPTYPEDYKRAFFENSPSLLRRWDQVG